MSILKLDSNNARAEKIIRKINHDILHLFPESEWLGKIWVAGGAVQAIVSKTKINDYDLFFPNTRDISDALALLKEDGFEVLIETESAVKLKKGDLKVDVVLKTFKDPEETIKAFDFTVACAAVDHESFYATFEFFFDLSSKSIAFQSLPMPIQTQKRLVKYIKKGFTPCIGAMMMLAEAIGAVDKSKFDEQKVAYFD